ncbi:hypothetical protein FEZ18_06020 [Oceanihabitans sp. IOP_32]|uniref:hypothetical protein n=1 Tax=Oceanihabitans sp. IOP_32 TaxID=2529032 RepID=UPI0012930269|nr:hypothetical protein [Oceanihabitans sp. IOP_32]QFZ54378.1 hypothetical protein FEZ18_06020 [Oceanihabitans sp. IOP_32]
MKKVLNIFMVVFFLMGSSYGLNASEEEIPNSECYEFAGAVYEGSMSRHGNSGRAMELAIWAYNDCLTW